MQQLLDYIAILAFVIVYFITRDIFLATALLLVGVTVQVAAYWLWKRPIGPELKMTFWASMILGGMTLILRDETFIQWKPSIVNWLLGAALLIAYWAKRIFLIEKMLGKVMRLPDEAWMTLTYGWAAAFTFVGVLNLWVAYNFSMDTWVTFKFAGLMGLNVVFLIATFGYLGAKGLLSDENLVDPNAPSAEDAANPNTPLAASASAHSDLGSEDPAQSKTPNTKEI